MFDSLIARIRQRSRDDYEEMLFSVVTDVRIWVQEHAERAALVFLGVGFFIPFFYKTLLFLGALAVLIGFIIWTIALPAGVTVSSVNEENDLMSPPSDDQSSNDISEGSPGDQNGNASAGPH